VRAAAVAVAVTTATATANGHQHTLDRSQNPTNDRPGVPTLPGGTTIPDTPQVPWARLLVTPKAPSGAPSPV